MHKVFAPETGLQNKENLQRPAFVYIKDVGFAGFFLDVPDTLMQKRLLETFLAREFFYKAKENIVYSENGFFFSLAKYCLIFCFTG